MSCHTGKWHANPETSGIHVLGFYGEVARGKKLKGERQFYRGKSLPACG
jgi:hypothetical protein